MLYRYNIVVQVMLYCYSIAVTGQFKGVLSSISDNLTVIRYKIMAWMQTFKKKNRMEGESLKGWLQEIPAFFRLYSRGTNPLSENPDLRVNYVMEIVPARTYKG